MRYFFIYISITFLFLSPFRVTAQDNTVYIDRWVTSPPSGYEKFPLIYVDFWATWCAPCISAMPHTQGLANIFGDEVLFLFLSDEPEDKIERFLKKRNLSLLAASDFEGRTFANFNIKSIPQSVIIGPEGELVWRGKPTELNERTLRDLISKYRYSEAMPGRIVLKKTGEPEVKMSVFTQDGLELKFTETQEAANEFVARPGNYYLSGDLSYIVSIIKNVPLPLVENQTGKNAYFMFSSAIRLDKNVFTGLVQSFICRKTPYKISENNKEAEVIVVTGGRTENFLSPLMYDFEKGDNTALIDDYGFMLDNATVSQMLELLSQRSGKLFVYEGNNKEKYDWNLQFTGWESLKKLLEEELGFRLQPTRRKITFYKLVRKNGK